VSQPIAPCEPGKPGCDTPVPMVVQDAIVLEDTDLCRSLFGLAPDAPCKIPTRLFFGGTFQTGARILNNPLTGRTDCPSGFQAYKLGVTDVPNTPTGNDITPNICWATVSPPSVSPACPEGQAEITQMGKKVCSTLPVVACQSFEGIFDHRSGRCQMQPFKTIFGGVFETGDLNTGRGIVSVLDPDTRDPNRTAPNNLVTKNEQCETPNTIAGLNTCTCPDGFQAFSSSTIVEEPVPGQTVQRFDRYSYCVRRNLADLQPQEVLTPVDGCTKSGEMKVVTDKKDVCTAEVASLCKRVGGVFSTTTRRCILPREEFFAGSYQIGHSPHFNATEITPKDPAETRIQRCEAPNPLSGLTGADLLTPRVCSCPAGFKAQVLILADEDTINVDYDREYLCIRDR